MGCHTSAAQLPQTTALTRSAQSSGRTISRTSQVAGSGAWAWAIEQGASPCSTSLPGEVAVRGRARRGARAAPSVRRGATTTSSSQQQHQQQQQQQQQLQQQRQQQQQRMRVGGRSWRKRQSGSGAVVARLLGERVDSWGAKDSGTGAVVALVPGDNDRRHQREIPTGDGTGDTKVISKRVLRRGDDNGER